VAAIVINSNVWESLDEELSLLYVLDCCDQAIPVYSQVFYYLDSPFDSRPTRVYDTAHHYATIANVSALPPSEKREREEHKSTYQRPGAALYVWTG
jgi:hypothetical protein